MMNILLSLCLAASHLMAPSQSIPANAIVFFNDTSCPFGYSSVPLFEGHYPLGRGWIAPVFDTVPGISPIEIPVGAITNAQLVNQFPTTTVSTTTIIQFLFPYYSLTPCKKIATDNFANFSALFTLYAEVFSYGLEASTFYNGSWTLLTQLNNTRKNNFLEEEDQLRHISSDVDRRLVAIVSDIEKMVDIFDVVNSTAHSNSYLFSNDLAPLVNNTSLQEKMLTQLDAEVKHIQEKYAAPLASITGKYDISTDEMVYWSVGIGIVLGNIGSIMAAAILLNYKLPKLIKKELDDYNAEKRAKARAKERARKKAEKEAKKKAEKEAKKKAEAGVESIEKSEAEVEEKAEADEVKKKNEDGAESIEKSEAEVEEKAEADEVKEKNEDGAESMENRSSIS